MLLHQRHHNQGHGPRGRGNHGRAPAEEGRGDRDAKGGVEPHLRIHPGDDGKGDGLGNERQGDHKTSEKIITDRGKAILHGGGPQC